MNDDHDRLGNRLLLEEATKTSVRFSRRWGGLVPRVKQLKFHVYDGTTLTYMGMGYDPPLTDEEAAAIPAQTREEREAEDHLYEIATWADGPREGEEGIVFLGGQNWIPAHWPVRFMPPESRTPPRGLVPNGDCGVSTEQPPPKEGVGRLGDEQG